MDSAHLGYEEIKVVFERLTEKKIFHELLEDFDCRYKKRQEEDFNEPAESLSSSLTLVAADLKNVADNLRNLLFKFVGDYASNFECDVTRKLSSLANSMYYYVFDTDLFWEYVWEFYRYCVRVLESALGNCVDGMYLHRPYYWLCLVCLF